MYVYAYLVILLNILFTAPLQSVYFLSLEFGSVAALHQSAPGQMTWLPPWLCPAYCFALLCFALLQ